MKKPSSKSFAAWQWCGIALTALVCYLLAYRYLNFVFYQGGSHLLDAGWFSGLLSGNDWRLLSPIALSHAGESFHRIAHVSPFLLLFTYLPTPLYAAEKIAFFYGLAMALYGAALWAAIYDYFARLPWAAGSAGGVTSAAGQTSSAARWLAAVAVAVVTALNGVSVEVLSFVHIELWMPVWLCAFLWATAFDKKYAAAASFVLLMMTREDAGFHFLTIVGLILLMRHARAGLDAQAQAQAARANMALWIYSAVALAGSLTLINIGGMAAPTPGVDASLMLRRLAANLTRPEWAWSFAILLVWAAVLRRPAMLLGLVSVLPWVLYHITLPLPVRGNLAAYYAFPLMLAFYWPFIAHRFFPPRAAADATAGRRKKKPAASPLFRLAHFGVLFAFAFALATLVARNEKSFSLDSEEQKLGKHSLVKFLHRATAETPAGRAKDHIELLGRFYAKRGGDNAIFVMEDFATLFPHYVPYDRLLRIEYPTRFLYDKMDMLIINSSASGSDSAKFVPMIAAAYHLYDLDYIYVLKETKYVVLSRAPLCDEAGACVDGLPLGKIAENTLARQITEIAAEKYVSGGFIFDGGALLAGAAQSRGMDRAVTSAPRPAVASDAGVMARMRGIALRGPGAVGIDINYAIGGGVTQPPLARFYNRLGEYHEVALPLAAASAAKGQGSQSGQSGSQSGGQGGQSGGPGGGLRADKFTQHLTLGEGLNELNFEMIHPGGGEIQLLWLEVTPQ